MVEARWNVLRVLYAVIKPNIVHIDVSKGSNLLWDGPTGRHLLLQHLLVHSYLLMVTIVDLARLKHQLVALLLHLRTWARRRNIVSVLHLEDTVRHVTELLISSEALRSISPIEHSIGNVNLHLSCVGGRLLLLLLGLERSCRTILHLSVCELLLLLSISAYLMLLLLLGLSNIGKLEVAIRYCL